MHAAYCFGGAERVYGKTAESIIHYLDAYENADDMNDRRMKGYVCLRLSELFADSYNSKIALDYATHI